MTLRSGAPAGEVELCPDATRLLRFGAVTGNAHRIHYDPEFARTQRLEGAVVMAQLHGCLFFRVAAQWAGSPVLVRSVGWQNRAAAYVGVPLTVTATVCEMDDEHGEVTLSIEERTGDGTVCCRGHARVVHEPAR